MSSSEDPREKLSDAPRHRQTYRDLYDGREPFFPNFLLKEWIIGAMFIVGFLIWVLLNKVGLGSIANPNDSSYIPVPDWYFLFLYQALKYYPGNGEVFGAFLVPVIVTLLLIFLPWIDWSKNRRPFKRPLATASMVLVIIMMSWLTAEAWAQHQAEVGGSAAGGSSSSSSSGLPFAVQHPTSTALMATSMPGYQLFENTCAGCHGQNLEGSVGPELRGIGNVASSSQLLPVITKGFPPNMPPGGGLTNKSQLQQIADWLSQQKQK